VRVADTADDTENTEPGPAPEPPPRRGLAGKTTRDMVLSLLVLFAVVGVVTAVTRGCSFSPGGPTIDPNAVPTVDQAAELRSAARRVDFPIRNPTAPAGWRANSAQVVTTRGGAPDVQVGWLTAGGRYLRLAQSSAAVPDLVASEGSLAKDVSLDPQGGTLEAAGVTWTGYPGQNGERSWVADLSGVRVLITGSGTADEARALATAVHDAPVLPRPSS
jgi:hypothetical protein